MFIACQTLWSLLCRLSRTHLLPHGGLSQYYFLLALNCWYHLHYHSSCLRRGHQLESTDNRFCSGLHSSCLLEEADSFPRRVSLWWPMQGQQHFLNFKFSLPLQTWMESTAQGWGWGVLNSCWKGPMQPSRSVWYQLWKSESGVWIPFPSSVIWWPFLKYGFSKLTAWRWSLRPSGSTLLWNCCVSSSLITKQWTAQQGITLHLCPSFHMSLSLLCILAILGLHLPQLSICTWPLHQALFPGERGLRPHNIIFTSYNNL